MDLSYTLQCIQFYLDRDTGLCDLPENVLGCQDYYARNFNLPVNVVLSVIIY